MVGKSHQQGSQITLVDTTGFIEGHVARIFKLHKIEMLRPQWIVALQAEDEMKKSGLFVICSVNCCSGATRKGNSWIAPAFVFRNFNLVGAEDFQPLR